MRATGIAWALAIGRQGGLAAAPLGKYLLALGLGAPPRSLSAGLLAALAAVAAAGVGTVGKLVSA